MGKPFTLVFLITLMIFQGISGIAGGAGLIYDPTGEAINIPQSWLEGTLFSDYFIPGIILFTVLGIFPLMVAAGLIKRKSWSFQCSLLIGTALIVWILVEIVMIGYKSNPPLQLIYGICGIMILLSAVRLRLPGYRSYPENS